MYLVLNSNINYVYNFMTRVDLISDQQRKLFCKLICLWDTCNFCQCSSGKFMESFLFCLQY